jgi:hypothetical protein
LTARLHPDEIFGEGQYGREMLALGIPFEQRVILLRATSNGGAKMEREPAGVVTGAIDDILDNELARLPLQPDFSMANGGGVSAFCSHCGMLSIRL